MIVHKQRDFFEWQVHKMPFVSDELRSYGVTDAVDLHKIVNTASGEIYYDGYDHNRAFAEWSALTAGMDDYVEALNEVLRIACLNVETPAQQDAVNMVLKFHNPEIDLVTSPEGE
jgi:hypothetical protein